MSVERLTEEFWRPLYSRFPEEVKRFHKWVDQYKERIEWNFLFVSKSIKYHDLPVAMQYGIFIQYVSENETSVSTINVFSIHKSNHLSKIIEEWFESEHLNSKKYLNGK